MKMYDIQIFCDSVKMSKITKTQKFKQDLP